MTGAQIIQSAFYAYLSGSCNITSTSISWPNMSFSPPSTGLWYVVSFMPLEPTSSALGKDAPNRHTGIFQILVCAPLEQGEGVAVTEAERLVVAMKRGMLIIKSGTTYTISSSPNGSTVVGGIKKSWRVQGFPSIEPACWQVPVRIQYWADVAN